MTEQHFSYNGHCTRIFSLVQNIFTIVFSQNRSPLCCSKLLAWFGLPSFKLACRVTTRKTKVTGCDQLLQVLVEILLLSTVEFLLLSTTDDTTKHFVSLCSKITQFFKVLCIAYKICCFKDVVLNTRTNPYFSKLISTYITTYSYHDHVQYSIQFNIGFSVVSNVLHKTTVICWMNLGLPAMRHKLKFP